MPVEAAISDSLSIIRRSTILALAAISILALLAYVRDTWRDDELAAYVLVDAKHYKSYSIVSDHGTLGIECGRYDLNPGHSYIDPQKPSPPRVTIRHVASPRIKAMAGLFDAPHLFDQPIHTDVEAGATDSNVLSAPDLTIALFSSLWPIYAYWKMRRARAIAMLGKCKRCGYDLRGSLGFCPECGPRDHLRSSS